MGRKNNELTLIPENFEVTDRIRELAKQNGWPDPDKEIDAFKDYHLAHGSRMLNWEAAFRTWLRNALYFRGQKKATVPMKTGLSERTEKILSRGIKK